MGNSRPTASDGARQTAAAQADILFKAWCEIYRLEHKNTTKNPQDGLQTKAILLNDSVESSVEKFDIE